MTHTYTHPDVLTVGVADGWADPETDPTAIDWPARQAAAIIPFTVVKGRPVNPCEPTKVRYGRNELGHWGEAVAADAIVTASNLDGIRFLLMVDRDDDNGWAVPGGMVEPGEDLTAAAIRELAEETGLVLPDAVWTPASPRYVPDPRASCESWIVTAPSHTHLGPVDRFPPVKGADDARRAMWFRADTYGVLELALAMTVDGKVFPAHVAMLTDHLDPN